MRRLSSIFSFNTLRLPCRVPRATVLALAILVALEAAAQVAIRTGKLQRDPSLHTLIDDHRRAIQTHAYEVWMFGNSMLDWGIDAAEFSHLTGKRVAKMPHGNATPRASVALLRYYLESTPRPRRPKSVMLFFAEDDINRNGYRADESQHYLDYVARKEKPKFYERIALFSARDNICRIIAKPVKGIPKLPTWRKRSRTGEEQFDPGDTDEIVVSAYAQKLLKNFKLDHGVIADFQKTTKQFKIKNIAVVIVPTTDVNAKRHDKLSPSLTCAQIRTRISDICAERKIPFMNPGQPSTLYHNFRDAYHLNNTGRQRYTAVIAAWYLSHSTDPAQLDLAKQVQPQAVQALIELGLDPP
jgi:hypothetical protein